MNAKMAVILAVLVFVPLTGCPRQNEVKAEASASEVEVLTDPIDDAYKGKTNSRTWAVYDTTGGHMVAGDAFRIELSGRNVKFTPLNKLRKSWGNSEGYSIELIKTGSAQKKLCGEVQIASHPPGDSLSHGPGHIMVISAVSDDRIDVAFYVKSDDVGRDEQCRNPQFHGGTAHAEN